MKRILALILMVSIIASVVSYRKNNDVRSLLAHFSQDDLDSAQVLSYRILLFGCIPVGSAVLYMAQPAEYKGKPVYHVYLEADSASELSWLYVASIRADSYVNRQTYLPEAFTQKIFVKGKQSTERGVVYAQDEQTMSVEGETRTIAGNTHDPLSAILRISRMDYDQLKDLELNINTNQKDYRLTGTAERADALVNRMARGMITVSADVKRRSDNPYHQSHIEIIMASGKKNIPVLIRSFASGFLVTSRLTSAQ